MSNKGVKLYNVIFPIWLLWIIPITWIVVIPANFIIDLTVIVLTLKYLKVTDIKSKAKSVILKTWILGFVADFIGTVFMLLSIIISFDTTTQFGRWWYDNITSAVACFPFSSIYSILWITICTMITSAFIYIFNYKICFKKLEIQDTEKKKLALSVAIFTAPYLFYLPTSWFF